jgi:HAD superfamily hydrolase (TIGR01509 family)
MTSGNWKMTEAGTMPSAILFDVDGTLIDSFRLYVEAYGRALQPYLGYAPDISEIAARHPSSERRFLTDWIGEERAEECHAAMCRWYADLHATHCEGLYDGVREMLAGLRSAGIPLGVVTGKGRRAWDVTSRELDFGHFEVVVTEDDVEHPKPDPGGLLRAANALGLPPGEIAYVGDSAADMEAGRLAGMRVGAALWPKEEPEDRRHFLERIRRFDPDWLLERPSELVRRFAPWC